MLVALTVLLLASVPAPLPTSGSLAVLELASPPTMGGMAAQIRQTVERSAQDRGFSVVSEHTQRERLGLEGLAKLQACQQKQECMAPQWAALGNRYAVTGSLNQEEGSYRLKLFLWDLTQESPVAQVNHTSLIAGQLLQPEVKLLTEALLRGEPSPTGQVQVKSTVPGAEVMVDGTPVGRTPLTVSLPPGKRVVTVKKDRYLEVERLITVKANQTVAHELPLLPSPTKP